MNNFVVTTWSGLKSQIQQAITIYFFPLLPGLLEEQSSLIFRKKDLG
tara:strand:+ start:25102 stop:25242 length:141 start_codon:yes stop_codon:yes gene_type:complete